MRKKTIYIIPGLILLGACAYASFFNTLYFIVGAFWGLANLYLIQQLLYGVLLAKQKSFLKIALQVLIKFPVLYGVGFALLYYQYDFAWAQLAGFSVVLLLCLQKWFWKVFQPDEMKVIMK